MSRSSAKAAKVPGVASAGKPRKLPRPPINQVPEVFTYALSACKAERRASGWYVARCEPVLAGSKPDWSGPFQSIESACLAMARRHATELADRHTRSVEHYGLDRDHKLFGLQAPVTL